jgi:hypothetical protein
MSDSTRDFEIDPRHEAYRQFFDLEWGKSIGDLSRGTVVEHPAFSLAASWKGISQARAFPWFLEGWSRQLLEGSMCYVEPRVVKTARVLGDKLIGRIESNGERLRPMLRTRIRQAISELDAEAAVASEVAAKGALQGLPSSWEMLVRESSFTFTVWSLERMCYGAIYYAYESFVLECLRIATGDPDFRIGRDSDAKRALQPLGAPASDCWSNQRIVIARMARHALVHNGGRLTRELAKQPHGFSVIGDEFQVLASDTTELYNLLKNKAMTLAVATIAGAHVPTADGT